MPKLIYSVIGSLDGYIADEQGNFDWAVPDEEVLAFVTARAERVTTYLHGRRMYELMQVWETDPAAAAQSPESAKWAEVWQRARKIVYSTTLESVPTRNTTLERTFDPSAVQLLKDESPGDLYVDGPTLAAHAFHAGLIDQVEVIVVPTIVGGGKRFYPDDVRLDLELEEERRFTNGMVHLQYRVRTSTDHRQE